MCPHETFWTLLTDIGHWEFELFIMLIVDGLLLGLLWPILHKHFTNHGCDVEPKAKP